MSVHPSKTFLRKRDFSSPIQDKCLKFLVNIPVTNENIFYHFLCVYLSVIASLLEVLVLVHESFETNKKITLHTQAGH